MFFLRGSNGDLLYAKTTTLEDTTNIVVEEIAIQQVSKYCKLTQYNNNIIQIDSLLLQKALEGE